MQSILTVVIPIVYTFAYYPLLILHPAVKKLSLGMQICLSLAWGSVTLIIVLSLFGMVAPRGFSFAANLLFYLMAIGASWGIYAISKTGICIPKTLSVTQWLIGLLVFIFTFIFFLKPIIDPDIIDSYLPLARTIIKQDRLPVRNYYDSRIFSVPPVGGPVLFAFFYAVAGTTDSEVFRLINLPFLFCFLFLTYRVARLYLSPSLAETSVLIVLMTPLVEDLIYAASLYPDFIFSFLAVFCFWVLAQILQETIAARPFLFYGSMGIAMAASFLLKYQAIFLYGIIGVIFLFTLTRHKGRYFLLPLIYAPLIGAKIVGIEPFHISRTIGSVCILLLPVAPAVLFLQRAPDISLITRIKYLGALILSGLGGSFLLRNVLLYGGFSDHSAVYLWSNTYESIIGVGKPTLIPIQTWALFLSPSFALWLFFPKIIGLWQGIRDRHILLPILIFTLWYSWWTLYLGGSDPRWMMPVLPYLAIIILIGLKRLARKEKRIEAVVWLSLPFMILTSKFIFWHLGIIYFGSSQFRTVTTSLEGSSPGTSIRVLFPRLAHSLFPLIDQLKQALTTALFSMTARTPAAESNLPLLLLLASLFSATTIVIARKRPPVGISYLLGIGTLILYGYVLIGISQGHITAFAEYEQKQVFNYWGQATAVVPYLQAHAEPHDSVIIVSDPTGLAYYINRRVYNLEYGGGLSVFYPVFSETDNEKIYQFYKQQHLAYVLIRDYGESAHKFSRLKEKTRIFDLLDNPQYATVVIAPHDEVHWFLYQIR